MKSFAHIFAFLMLLGVFTARGVFAADEPTRTEPPTPTSSPFGSLSDEKNQNRNVLDTQGRTVEDYRRTLQEYRDLGAQVERSFGAQRTTLQEQALARAKDVLYSKLGAVETHLNNLSQRLGGLNLLSEADSGLLNSQLTTFQAFLSGVRTRIDEADTLDALRAISVEINRQTALSVTAANYYNVKLSIQKGLAIVDALAARADLVQAHINAAGERGGNVAGIQTSFDSAMLNLENAKDSYTAIGLALGSIDPANTNAVSAQLQAVRQANTNVASAQTALKDIIRDLTVLYGQSPWTLEAR